MCKGVVRFSDLQRLWHMRFETMAADKTWHWLNSSCSVQTLNQPSAHAAHQALRPISERCTPFQARTLSLSSDVLSWQLFLDLFWLIMLVLPRSRRAAGDLPYCVRVRRRAHSLCAGTSVPLTCTMACEIANQIPS